MAILVGCKRRRTTSEYAWLQLQFHFSIREGKWKYIEYDPENPTNRTAENSDQLYDLENDPGELQNLFSQYPEIVERLKAKLIKVKPQR